MTKRRKPEGETLTAPPPPPPPPSPPVATGAPAPNRRTGGPVRIGNAYIRRMRKPRPVRPGQSRIPG